MQQKIDYKGHTIYAETTRQGNGWVGAYQIDTGPWRRNTDSPAAPEELVLKEAISDAQHEIDSMG